MTLDAYYKAKALTEFNALDNEKAKSLAEKVKFTMIGSIFEENVSAFIKSEINAMNERYLVELSKIQ